ncbi:hypothetical protein KBTX_02592 [wastewater metagenome]|uniref:Uncharacterized protein n=4 Tax=root TaxID=1 RepID=A0A5B8RC93_9ZZZZ|nr:hypothetical protein KBTEX_02592 [uncultured organism]
MRRILPLVIAIAASTSLLGCASRPPTPPTSPEQGEGAPMSYAPGERYHIGPDDELSVNVWRNPDLSVVVPVRPDGMISVPLVGDVAAGGHTPEEVAKSIREALAYYVREPQVTVVVTELNSHEYLSRVRVTGAVEEPASVPWRQGMTVLDLVLEAGGMTEFAAPGRAMLYRRTGDRTEAFAVHLDDILERGDLTTNVALQPGDVITIPERVF